MKKPNMSNINKPKNILIKARKSTSPFSNTLSDPMNSLQNTYLKEKRINMIMNFLVLNNYPNNFSKKEFINMTIDFRPNSSWKNWTPIPIYWIRKPRTKLKHWRKYMNILEN